MEDWTPPSRLPPQPRPMSVHAGKDEAAAWSFVFLASAAGWDVDVPRNNGYGYFNVNVFDDTPGPARTPPTRGWAPTSDNIRQNWTPPS